MTSSLSKTPFKSCDKNVRKIVRIARTLRSVEDVLYLSHGRFLLKTRATEPLSRSVQCYSVVSIGEDPDDDALRFSSSSLSGDKPLPLVLLRKRGETETF